MHGRTWMWLVAGVAWLAGIGFRAASGDDWTQWGGGRHRNLVSRETGVPSSFFPGKKRRDRLGFDPATTKNVRWLVRLGSENDSGPVVANGNDGPFKDEATFSSPAGAGPVDYWALVRGSPSTRARSTASTPTPAS